MRTRRSNKHRHIYFLMTYLSNKVHYYSVFSDFKLCCLLKENEDILHSIFRCLQESFVHMQFWAGKHTCLLHLAHKQDCLWVQQLFGFSTLFSAGKQELNPLWWWWLVDRLCSARLDRQNEAMF